MTQTCKTIGIFPAFCIIALAIGLMNHVLVIPPLLEAAQTGCLDQCVNCHCSLSHLGKLFIFYH